MRRIGFASIVLGLLVAASGCAVRPLPGERVMAPPQVVIEEPVEHWHWWWWPHYDVEHRYIVNHRAVIVRDHHYYPFYEQFNPYVRRDGARSGWYQHHRDES